ncbi:MULTISPECIES: hypothetical protein [Glutamicibacter]
MSVSSLAKKTGYSTNTIIRWTSEPREVYLGRAADRHQKIHELREQGLSMRAIAEEIGISARAVHYALHKDADKRDTA